LSSLGVRRQSVHHISIIFSRSTEEISTKLGRNATLQSLDKVLLHVPVDDQIWLPGTIKVSGKVRENPGNF
jgi:hypothetical protein